MNKIKNWFHTYQFSKALKQYRQAIVLTIGLLLTIAMTGMVSFEASCQQVREDVLRLHILANSDQEADQQLKLKVRDRVLKEARKLFHGELDLSETEQTAAEHLPALIAAAQDEVYQNGYTYPVDAQLVNMYFETREYEGFTMPAGRYNAVRFTIGEGKGHNWWCVMFPPMCIPVSLKEQPDLSAFTASEIKLIERKPQYEPRFALVELLESLKEKLD